jgi:hypothetical protein
MPKQHRNPLYVLDPRLSFSNLDLPLEEFPPGMSDARMEPLGGEIRLREVWDWERKARNPTRHRETPVRATW